MELFDTIKNVHDKEGFLIFLDGLINDFTENKYNWENQDINSFLEAIHGWVSDYHGDDINFSNPTWKEFAAILYMGKIYE